MLRVVQSYTICLLNCFPFLPPPSVGEGEGGQEAARGDPGAAEPPDGEGAHADGHVPVGGRRRRARVLRAQHQARVHARQRQQGALREAALQKDTPGMPSRVCLRVRFHCSNFLLGGHIV